MTEPTRMDDSLLRRVRAEFMEMPGMSLTLAQASRLWSLEQELCRKLLTSLVESRFLVRTRQDLFVRA